MQRLEPLLAPIYGMSLRFVLVSAQVLKELLRSDESVDICHHAENLLLANFILCDNNMLTNACKTMTALK